MPLTGIILVGAGFLLGNQKARNQFVTMLQQLAGSGIDALNKMGGGELNATEQPMESKE